MADNNLPLLLLAGGAVIVGAAFFLKPKKEDEEEEDKLPTITRGRRVDRDDESDADKRQREADERAVRARQQKAIEDARRARARGEKVKAEIELDEDWPTLHGQFGVKVITY